MWAIQEIQIQNPLAQSIGFFQEFEKFKIWKNKNIARNYFKSKNKDFEKLKIVKKFWKIKSF